VAADCSTPARQPQEMHGHRGWTDELMAPATSMSQQSIDGDERRLQQFFFRNLNPSVSKSEIHLLVLAAELVCGARKCWYWMRPIVYSTWALKPGTGTCAHVVVLYNIYIMNHDVVINPFAADPVKALHFTILV